jgi:lipopolysaccharide/colanic/teichoic acid biosynthesis glycosyltransferase
VLPGMTGLWQVSGRSDAGFDELIRLDFSYIESWSIWLDLEILFRTIPTVIFRRGAF